MAQKRSAYPVGITLPRYRWIRSQLLFPPMPQVRPRSRARVARSIVIAFLRRPSHLLSIAPGNRRYPANRNLWNHLQGHLRLPQYMIRKETEETYRPSARRLAVLRNHPRLRKMPAPQNASLSTGKDISRRLQFTTQWLRSYLRRTRGPKVLRTSRLEMLLLGDIKAQVIFQRTDPFYQHGENETTWTCVKAWYCKDH
jgi:hypothetical protein